MASKGDEAQRLIADPAAAFDAKTARRVVYLRATVAMASVLVCFSLYKSVRDNLTPTHAFGKFGPHAHAGDDRGGMFSACSNACPSVSVPFDDITDEPQGSAVRNTASRV